MKIVEKLAEKMKIIYLYGKNNSSIIMYKFIQIIFVHACAKLQDSHRKYKFCGIVDCTFFSF